MSMLAEPRRKQKWTLNPRGKQWSEDSNKFGQKMLEKMGWTSGKGLGAKEQGMTEHVRVKFKDDQSGIGYSKNDQDKEWTQHQEGFNDLLMNLQKSQNLEATELMETKEIALSGTSLEQKSKQSKARVHYQKFTRGKDVNKYSPKDLANIFGKKTLEEKSKHEEKVEEEFNAEPVGFRDNTGGVVTIKGGNISEYFKSKMPSTMKKNFGEKECKPESSESNDERYVGFGFNNTKTDQCGSYSQSVKDFTNYAFENHCLDLNVSPKVKPWRKRKSLAFANEGLDLNYSDKSETPKKKKTDFEASESSECFVNPALNLDSPANETYNGAEFEVSRPQCALVNPALDLSEEKIKKKPRKKRKKNVELSGVGFVNPALNLDCPIIESHNGTEFEVSRIQMGLANDALDLSDEASGKKRVTFNDLVEYNTDIIKKKKGKTKLDKFEVENDKLKRKKKRTATEEVRMVFVNEALDVEATSEEVHDNELNERKCRKEKRKKTRRMSNLETIEEAPEEKEISEDVICDLEVITLQDCVEEPEEIGEVTSKKIKNKKKKEEKIQENLDVIEITTVIQEKSLTEDNLQVSEETNGLKKKKKEKKNEGEVEGTINGFDKENEEIILVEKRKKKKKRKSIENCEFFLDEVIEEKVEVVEIEEKIEKLPSESKKAKKKRSRDSEVKPEPEEDSECKVEINTEGYSTPSKKRRLGDEISEVSQSPCEMMAKKSKNVLKAMFAKSPVVYFKGSNINEIKGYGVD